MTNQMGRAKKIVWLTIGYLLFDMTLLYFTMQNSQAMKASLIEDMLYLVPSICFLVSNRLSRKPPDENFRYGYNRAYSIGFLVSAFALFAIGGFLLFESLMKLVNHEVITIGTFRAFGETIWFGWLMILTIGYSIIPVYLIGRAKLKIAKKVNLQLLYVDAKGQKADWLTSVATIFGILGIGYGLWWTDAVAAIIIAIDILSDAFKSLKASFSEAMDRMPIDPLLKNQDPIVERVEEIVSREKWIENFVVRFQKSGNKIRGEVLVIAPDAADLKDKIFSLRESILNMDWQIEEVGISPVRELPLIIKKGI